MSAFTLVINVDGSPVRWIGEATAGKEESANGIAEFAFVPTKGASHTPDSLVGKSVTFVYNGTTAWTGTIASARPNLTGNTIAVTASDGLVEHFNTLTEAQILAAITGSRWNANATRPRQSGWEQAKEALETTLLEVHMDRLGSLTTGDLTTSTGTAYAAADVVHASESVDLAPAGQLINKVTIKFSYTYTRLKQRHHDFTWTWGMPDFCTWKNTQFTLPSRSMVEEGARSTGWPVIGGITMQTLPDAVTGLACGDWTPSADQQKIDVVTADWDGFRRWAQEIEQSYTLTVQAPDSITRYGEQAREVSRGYVTPFEGSDWTNDTSPYAPAFSADVLGDYSDEQDDTTERDDILEILLLLARRKIWDGHRKNYAEFSVVCEPTLDLADGRSVSTAGLTAAGKVAEFTHRWKVDEGDAYAITVITLAVPRGGGTTGDDSLTAPTAPDTSPTHGPLPGSALGTTLPTTIGNSDTAPNWDSNATGYTGKYLTAQGSPTPAQSDDYQDRFRPLGVDIEAAARDKFTASASQTYNLEIPDHSLSITVNPA